MITAVKAKDVKYRFKELCSRIIGGETIIVSRPQNENIVLLSETEYTDLERARQNAEYLSSIDRRYAALERGEGKYHELIED